MYKPQPLPERRKRNVFIDLRKFLSDINIRATKGAFQSANFVEGETGWQMSSNGLIEGTRLKLDNFVPSHDSSIVYSPIGFGGWTEGSIVVGYDLTPKISSTIGHSFQITFTGTSIGLIFPKASNSGKVSISIDGGGETLVDLYQSQVTWRSIVFSAEGLSSGTHTLVGTVAEKNPDSSDNIIAFQGYVKSPGEGIKLSDISADLYLFAGDITTDGNGYAESTSFILPADKIVWAITGVAFNDESIMSDATLTEPKLAWRDQSVYLYNGAANETYSIIRTLIISII